MPKSVLCTKCGLSAVLPLPTLLTQDCYGDGEHTLVTYEDSPPPPPEEQSSISTIMFWSIVTIIKTMCAFYGGDWGPAISAATEEIKLGLLFWFAIQHFDKIFKQGKKLAQKLSQGKNESK